MDKEDLHFKKIAESLRLLVASSSTVSELFEPFVDVPFEVLDTYRNAFVLTPRLVEQGVFTYPQIADLIRLEMFVSQLLRIIDADESEGFGASVARLSASVRHLAERLLDALDEPHAPVDMRFV
jgi:hypothetical protein